MATTLRKISRLAAISRAAGGVAAFSTSCGSLTRHQLLLQTASNSYSQKSVPWFPSSDRGTGVQNGFAGTMCYSSAAAMASVAQEVNEKDMPESNKIYVPNDVVLYQYQACPFCNKVKAFLDYYNIPHKIVEVNPINKKEIKWSDYKKVPILMVDGEQMVNSSDIIDKLYQRVCPDSNPGDDEVQKWRGWVDNHLVHVLSPNIYRSPSEALESFDYITGHGNFSFTEKLVAKYAGAAAMYFVSKKLKKRHNIADERGALYEAANTWVDALNGRQYLGGSEPNLADLAVFGVLRPIRYLKSGKDMVENTRIGEWYTRMETEMECHRGLKLQAE